MDKKIKILLVEDDPNLGSLLSDYLNAKGHSWQRMGRQATIFL
jgi:DNA-binding response OmpR family regulator